MEFNDLIESGDWLELRHVINRPDTEGHVTICKFNAALVSRAQAATVAALLGFPLPGELGEVLGELGPGGNLDSWKISDL